MASERTFFKWFRTGMQIGAIGTFVFIALDKREESPLRFAVVAFAWLIGLLLVLYGVYSYYQRRGAIRRGDVEIVPDRLREHSPILVVVSLILVVSAGLAYALYTGQTPHKGHSMPRPPVQPAPQPAPAQRIPRDGALKRGGYSAVQRRWAGGHPPVAPPDIMAMAGSL